MIIFVYFSDITTNNKLVRTAKNYYWTWNMRTIFDKLKNTQNITAQLNI
jgi:hypothetical protein